MLVKLEGLDQFDRNLIDRRDPYEVETFNNHQKKLGGLSSLLDCISGNSAAPERFIKLLTPERESREQILSKLQEATKRFDLHEEFFEAMHLDYTDKELEVFYKYYLDHMEEAVVVLEEKITDPRIKWGTDESLAEAEAFEKYIEENAAPLPGLPDSINLIPGDCVGISAPTGSGKTTALIGIAIKQLNLGKKVILLALEETEVETRTRVVRNLHDKQLHKNLGIVEVNDFKESTFRNDFIKLLKNTGADVILIDYINDNFMVFDKSFGLQAYEKIKKTVSEISDINHKVIKSVMILGVQGTAQLLTANKEKILLQGKAFFEGGQSTIKPLQYAIIIKEAEKEDGNYEKMAFIIKERNILVRHAKKVIPMAVYGMNYDKDQYSFNFVGSLKDIVNSKSRTKEDDAGEKTQNKVSTGGRR